MKPDKYDAMRAIMVCTVLYVLLICLVFSHPVY